MPLLPTLLAGFALASTVLAQTSTVPAASSFTVSAPISASTLASSAASSPVPSPSTTATSPFNFPAEPSPGAVDPSAKAPFSTNTTYSQAAPNATVPSGSDPLTAAHLLADTGKYGPDIELVHLFYNYWPVGISVASSGKIFVSYPRGNESYTLGVVTNETAEQAWPNQEWNTPPSFTNTTNPANAAAYDDHFLLIQSVVIDGQDRVWALDTGRPTVNGTALPSSPYGPKLVGFNLNGTHLRTIAFPPNVAYSDSSLNDVRFDLRSRDGFPQGVAYITDSSAQRPAIVVVNLGSGKAWRHLDGHPSTLPEPGFVPSYGGVPFYRTNPGGNGLTNLNTGADGIALSPDGEYLYYSPLAGRTLYRVPTGPLRVEPSNSNPAAVFAVSSAVQNLGGKGGSHSDGLETGADGTIYSGAPEINGIVRYDNTTGLVRPFVRDPRIIWPDTLSAVTLQGNSSGTNGTNGSGGYLYWTVNQLWLSADYMNGTDVRTYPGAIFRVPIPGGKAPQTLLDVAYVDKTAK